MLESPAVEYTHIYIDAQAKISKGRVTTIPNTYCTFFNRKDNYIYREREVKVEIRVLDLSLTPSLLSLTHTYTRKTNKKRSGNTAVESKRDDHPATRPILEPFDA